MATATVERKKTELIRTSRRAAAKGKTETVSDIFAKRDKMMLRGEYELVGRVWLLRTENGDIEFPGSGRSVQDQRPMIAELKASGEKQFVFLEPWEQFPAIVTNTEKLCYACRTQCAFCSGKGKCACQGLRCGGEGKMVLSYVPCTAKRCKRETGTANPKCKTCGGAGQVQGETAVCPTCKGSKVQQCPGCLGSGKMSTGRLNGAARDSQAEDCPACHGSGRKQKTKEQPYANYLLGKLEGYSVLGPVYGMIVHADVLRDPERHYERIDFMPDEDNNLAAVFVKHPEKTGQNVYLFGGIPQLTRL